jgi:hypothetical protein
MRTWPGLWVLFAALISGGAPAVSCAAETAGPLLDVLFSFVDLRNQRPANSKIEARASPHAIRVRERLEKAQLQVAGTPVRIRYHRDATVLDLHRALLDSSSLGVIWFSHGTAIMVSGGASPFLSRIPDLHHADAGPIFRLPEARGKYMAILSCNAKDILPDLAQAADGSKFLAEGLVLSPRRGLERALPHLRSWLASRSDASATGTSPQAVSKRTVRLRIKRTALTGAAELAPVQMLIRGKLVGMLDSGLEQELDIEPAKWGSITFESTIRDLRPFGAGRLEMGTFEVAVSELPDGTPPPRWKMFVDRETGRPFGVLERVMELVREPDASLNTRE